MFDPKDYYFRIKYRKLNTSTKLSNGLRCDFKFESDSDNNYVFFLYPEFETLSDESIVGDEWEALDEGTAIIHKPIFPPTNTDYYDMIRERVKIGAKGFFTGGSSKIAELEIIEIINDI